MTNHLRSCSMSISRNKNKSFNISDRRKIANWCIAIFTMPHSHRPPNFQCGEITQKKNSTAIIHRLNSIYVVEYQMRLNVVQTHIFVCAGMAMSNLIAIVNSKLRDLRLAILINDNIRSLASSVASLSLSRTLTSFSADIWRCCFFALSLKIYLLMNFNLSKLLVVVLVSLLHQKESHLDFVRGVISITR